MSNTAYLLVRPFVLAHYLASEAYKGVLRTCAELPPTSCCNASRSVSEPLEMCNVALQHSRRQSSTGTMLDACNRLADYRS